MKIFFYFIIFAVIPIPTTWLIALSSRRASVVYAHDAKIPFGKVFYSKERMFFWIMYMIWVEQINTVVAKQQKNIVVFL